MKHILITGGTGFIGVNLVRKFSQKKVSIVVISRQKNNPFSELSNVIFCGQISTMDDIERVFEHYEFDLVIHLATFYRHEPTLKEIDTMIESNIQFGVAILELASRYGCKKVINASSVAEFDSTGASSPNSLYASTKLAFRNICHYFERENQMSIINLVLYDNYGVNDLRGKIIDLLIERLNSDEVFNMSPGEQILYPVYIDDTVSAFMTCVENFQEIASQSNNIFCIASDSGVSLRKLAQTVEKITMKELNINWGGLPYRQNENMIPWTGERLPGWKPQISLEEGIKKLL